MLLVLPIPSLDVDDPHNHTRLDSQRGDARRGGKSNKALVVACLK
jgi:hypothetical protein